MNVCRDCHTQLVVDAQFCHTCGAPVGEGQNIASPYNDEISAFRALKSGDIKIISDYAVKILLKSKYPQTIIGDARGRTKVGKKNQNLTGEEPNWKEIAKSDNNEWLVQCNGMTYRLLGPQPPESNSKLKYNKCVEEWLDKMKPFLEEIIKIGPNSEGK